MISNLLHSLALCFYENHSGVQTHTHKHTYKSNRFASYGFKIAVIFPFPFTFVFFAYYVVARCEHTYKPVNIN